MFGSMLTLVALSLGAPKIKESPKKEPPIVGKWQLVEWLDDGDDVGGTSNTVHEFTADGKRFIRQNDVGTETGRTYKFVSGVGPIGIDLIRPTTATETETHPAILKIDGDRLVLSIARPGKERPKNFDCPSGSNLIRMTFRRVKND
jgi:uncharacterized protein (TIGR03067 family)